MSRQVLREIVRRARNSIVDVRTQNILISEAKKRIRRDQPRLLLEVQDLVDRAHRQDTHSIQPILRRCYLQGLYRDHEVIRYFLKAQISNWPSESMRIILEKQKNSLDFTSNNPKLLHKIKFPETQHAPPPSVSTLMGVTTDKEIEPLPLEPSTTTNEELNDMLTKVLKLYKFIRSTSYIHSRNLASPVVQFPLTIYGEEIAECRKKNLIKKKISHIRNVFMTIPPLEREDSEYLTNLLDSYYISPPPFPSPMGLKVRREYKKFLRKTYILTPDFTPQLNKYAHIKANTVNKDIYFQKFT